MSVLFRSFPGAAATPENLQKLPSTISGNSGHYPQFAEKPLNLASTQVCSRHTSEKIMASYSFSLLNSSESFSQWQTLNLERHREGDSGKLSSQSWKEVTVVCVKGMAAS